jgi:Ca2+-binding RTX toxin-like protein
MPTIKIKNDTNTTYAVNSSDMTYVLLRDVAIDGPMRGIEEASTSSGNNFILNGTVFVDEDNGLAVFSEGAATQIEIGQTGKVAAEYGIYTGGNNATIVNEGRIKATSIAVEMEGDNSRLVNHGTISSRDSYAYYAFNTDKFTLINDGRMISDLGLHFDADKLTVKFGSDSVVEAENNVITFSSDMDETSHLINEGRIEATAENTFLVAIVGDEGDDSVRNRGTIKGDVTLGSGNDLFDGRGGQVIQGVVTGGEDSDTYILGDNKTRVFEEVDAGYDRLTVGFTYKLGASNAIEEVMLSGKGDFKLVGSNMGTYLEGNSGNNRLIGGSGNDAFSGGKGVDVMTGGEGLDGFYFRPNANREVVTDFVDGVDRIVLGASEEVTSYQDLLAHHVKNVEGGMLIFGDDTELFLKGMTKADFGMEDFIS